MKVNFTLSFCSLCICCLEWEIVPNRTTTITLLLTLTLTLIWWWSDTVVLPSYGRIMLQCSFGHGSEFQFMVMIRFGLSLGLGLGLSGSQGGVHN